MKLYRIAPTAVAILLSIVFAISFLTLNPSKPRAIAAEPPAAGNPGDSFSPYVDKNGNISLPKGYRQKWAHLGSWAVAKKRGSDIFQMHSVYTPAATIASYNKTGEFPDGAVIVKEVRESKTDGLTTGHAAWSTHMNVWFVMVKDQKGRFKESKHWGEGWGWALFEAKDPTKNASVDYATSCIDCHSPVEDSDWVYVYGYPELKSRQQ